MEDQVRRLNGEYGFNLSEDEIKLVARQAEEAERLFQTLHEIDLTHVMPILKVDNEKVKT
jgi:Asp-tRNA(Asn)/Glu-tRNA(Gln) amidotransferase C subunit